MGPSHQWNNYPLGSFQGSLNLRMEIIKIKEICQRLFIF